VTVLEVRVVHGPQSGRRAGARQGRTPAALTTF